MSKDLNTIIKDTLRTISGIETYELFKDNVKDIKAELKPRDQYWNNSQYKKAKRNMYGNILIEGIRIGMHALAKGTIVTTAGAYIYGAITGDTSVADALLNSPVLLATAVYGDFTITKDTKKDIKKKQERKEQKIRNEEFKKRMEEREEEFKKHQEERRESYKKAREGNGSFYTRHEQAFRDAFNSEEFKKTREAFNKQSRQTFEDMFNENYKKFFEDFIGGSRSYAGSRDTGSRNTSRIFFNNIESCYQTLGVKYPAPIADVKKAYRTIAKQTHPDFNNGDQSRVPEFQKATDAYNRIEKYLNNERINK